MTILTLIKHGLAKRNLSAAGITLGMQVFAEVMDQQLAVRDRATGDCVKDWKRMKEEVDALKKRVRALEGEE